MAKYYKLVDALPVARKCYVPYLAPNGVITRTFRTFYPNVKYDEFINDAVFLNWLKEEAHVRIQYTPEHEEALKKYGARYEVYTPSCKCSGKKLDVWFMEVVE